MARTCVFLVNQSMEQKQFISFTIFRPSQTGMIEEHEVEQSEPRGREPREGMFEIVVWLMLQRIIFQQREFFQLGPESVVGRPKEIDYQFNLLGGDKNKKSHFTCGGFILPYSDQFK